MTAVSVMPKMQLITTDMVRASVKRARRSLEAAAEEIVWQIRVEGWRNLGYTSWTAMREGEYGGAAFMVPSKSRPEIVARIKAIEVGRSTRGDSKHLTDQEIAETVGVSRAQVQDDLNGNNKKSSSGHFADPDEDILDAELVEDDTPAEPPRPKRRPITDRASEAGWEIRKATEKLQRILEDDRLGRNKEEVAAHLRGHLIYAVESLQDSLDTINDK